VSEVLAQPFVREAIGQRGEQRRFEVTADAIRKYAAATDDTTPAASEGRSAPPVYAIVPVWETIAPASRAVASDKARRRVVHYEQDMLLHAPIEAGMSLVSDAAAIALLPRPNGTSLVIHTRTTTPEGALVNEQYVTEFFRGVEATDGLGERAPDHRLPDDVTSTAPRAEIRYEVADDQPARYAEASGDFFEIHLDDAAARAVGLPGRIVHGLCTMAFTGRAVLEAAGVDDPGAVARLAVRFSAPLLPGDSVATRIWELEDGVFGFEALDGQGRAVIKDGRAELRA
jgi:acyl dehydratase